MSAFFVRGAAVSLVTVESLLRFASHIHTYARC
jgi:hypothetical protein